jgi:hypothetical protein
MWNKENCLLFQGMGTTAGFGEGFGEEVQEDWRETLLTT